MMDAGYESMSENKYRQCMQWNLRSIVLQRVINHCFDFDRLLNRWTTITLNTHESVNIIVVVQSSINNDAYIYVFIKSEDYCTYIFSKIISQNNN